MEVNLPIPPETKIYFNLLLYNIIKKNRLIEEIKGGILFRYLFLKLRL